MTKKEFLESYAECVQRIRLKETQSEGKWIPDRLSEEVKALEKRRKQILAAIESVPDPEARAILEARYINGMTVERTALQISCSVRTVQRLTEKALRRMRFPADVA